MDRRKAMEILSEWHERGTPDLVQREATFDLPTTKNACAIVGPRRAGKSFFLYEIIANRLRIPIEDSIFINLEDHRLGIPSTDDLDLLLATYYEMYPEKMSSRVYLFLGEVQNVDDWEGFVRTILDKKDISILISGSSSKLLSREIATRMRGRSIEYLILPFSFKEYLKVRGSRISRSPSTRAQVMNHLKEYLRFGGFPDVVLEESEMVKRKTLRQYIDVMIFRDVVERHDVKNIKVLKLLMGQMMASSANLLSLNKFNGFLRSQGIRIDKNSVYEYKDHLVDAYGYIELKRINGSFRTIEQGLPKIYPIDTGYMTDYGMDIDDNIGRFMETCVAVELMRSAERDPGLKCHFWREKFEVDFVLSKGGTARQLIQVCYDLDDKDTKEREVRGLVRGSMDLNCDDLVIINWDQEGEEEIQGREIKIIPLWIWLTDYE